MLLEEEEASRRLDRAMEAERLKALDNYEERERQRQRERLLGAQACSSSSIANAIASAGRQEQVEARTNAHADGNTASLPEHTCCLSSYSRETITSDGGR